MWPGAEKISKPQKKTMKCFDLLLSVSLFLPYLSKLCTYVILFILCNYLLYLYVAQKFITFQISHLRNTLRSITVTASERVWITPLFGILTREQPWYELYMFAGPNSTMNLNFQMSMTQEIHHVLLFRLVYSQQWRSEDWFSYLYLQFNLQFICHLC